MFDKTEEDNNSFIESLHQWLIHRGIFFYTENKGSEVYKLLARKLQWDIHVICYNNGGYYNWHKDEKNSNIVQDFILDFAAKTRCLLIYVTHDNNFANKAKSVLEISNRNIRNK